MISWEEYIKSNILEFRKRYETTSEEFKKFVEKDKKASLVSLNDPSQVVIIDFIEPYPKCFIVFHNKKYPDMRIIVFENVAFEGFFSKVLKEPRWLELFNVRETKGIERAIQSKLKDLEQVLQWEYSWSFLEKSFLLVSHDDPRSLPRRTQFLSVSLMILANHHERKFREKRRKVIEAAVGDIKRDAEEISRIELKTKIIEATERLESQIEQLDKKHEKLRDELVGVRKLVGTETFGEWKVLLSEIDKINTRIDALSDIRSAYDKVLGQQNEFMKQQAEVMKQQSSFIKWIKYATILLPIAVISVPVIEIISIWIRHSLGIL